MTERGTLEFRPDYATSAGDFLLNIIEQLGMTQADLAARTGLSTKHINQIVRGRATISPETATQFEYSTGVPAETWATLDARHHALAAKERTKERFSGSMAWLDRFNLKELAARGVIDSSAKTLPTLESLLRYFGISDPDGWERVWEPSITSFRRSPSFTPDATATTLWLRAGQRAAARIDCSPYDLRALHAAVKDLRTLTAADPAAALPQLQARMARLGVAVVYIAEFEGCRASGATWWASPSKAVVLLSNRGKREDRFWFSFFHEIGHVLFHAKRDTFLDQTRGGDEDSERPPWADPTPSSGFIDDGSRDTKLEQEADQFASEALIPARYRPLLAAIHSPRDVERLAEQIGVASGVVAGRYQYETGDYAKFNKLRRQVPDTLFDTVGG